MSRTFKPSELPNPIFLTDPANLAYMKKVEEEEQKAKDAAALAPITNQKKRKADASGPSKPTKKAKGDGASSTSGDLFSISLPGDDDATVEIYDSCDELRKKINALLRTGTITKAALLRDMSRAAYKDAPNIQSKQLTDFLTKKGPTSGSTSRVCYASYVYFEKKRIAEGKAKSKHRRDMEDRWEGEGGMPRERERGYFCHVSDRIVQDSLGSVRVIPGARF